MSIPAAIVVFMMLWFLCLFVALPIRVRTQAEEGDVVPGTPESAPAEPMLRPKMLWATAAALVLWGVVFYIVVFSGVTMQDIDVWRRP